MDHRLCGNSRQVNRNLERDPKWTPGYRRRQLSFPDIGIVYTRLPILPAVQHRRCGAGYGCNAHDLQQGALAGRGVRGEVQSETPFDLDGKKIGAAGPNLELFRGSGITPVNTNAGEAYNALKSGIYDGIVLFPGFFQSIKLGEVAPHFTMVNIGSPSALSININLDTWNSLPGEVQRIFEDVGREAEYLGAVAANAADDAGAEKLMAEGVMIHEFPFEEKATWAANLSALPNEKAQEANTRGEPGSEVFGTYIQMLKLTGYEWPNEYHIE